ncbi:MAG: efflux RND transporter periplasmic adaptor subunit [Nitrospiraceae bacterium]|nr:efflux RND transporter periplasmic adaptor subunit [Nitrospira sp.]MCA9455208.1 efflux RND transporter periplasmic adaptor subunit [Nitrospira sp.]MCB9776261.1 efflux RND transporter periplasmic adaptor subunit [Nitrospiraceae bacterium]
MKKTFWIVAIIILAGAVGGWVYYFRSTGQPSPETAQHNVVEVVRTSLQTKVSETGTIMPSQTIEIKSQFSGEVAQLFVTAGQEVEKDQVLAIIRQESSQARQVAQLRAGISEERLNVDTAHREWIRAESLFRKGFIPQKELELSHRDYQQSLVRLELAERQLLLALGGNKELYERYRDGSASKTRPEEFQVRSPSQGTVLEILVHTGEIITSGTATFGGGTILMRIADLSHMVVKAKINEVNIPRVSVGQSVDIRLDALPEKLFTGRVMAIAAQGVKENNLVTYEVSIDIEKTHPDLKPMLTANIDIETKRLDNVLTVPLEVLRVNKGDDVVDVLVEGQPQTRKVRVAFRTDTQAIITQGLQEHDQVVVPSFKADEARR